ncbi:HIT family protein [Candidatus Woesearchaeota archaeon]|nr:MAG: HIT family protein [Candidatus Woesearchaeota archaeon]
MVKMSNCEICKKIEQKAAKVVYEDDKVFACLTAKPASLGHILVMPKEHFSIIEMVPDPLFEHLFKVVNKISIAVFEALHAQGTNIIIQNGVAAGQDVPHFLVHIIPRMQNDNLSFKWAPKQLNEEEMSTVEMMLKDQTSTIGMREEKKKPVEVEQKEDETISGEDNYLLKQLKRLP